MISIIVYDQHKSPEEPLKDKMLINHHYSVIRHEVKHAPDVDGMATIKVLCFPSQSLCVRVCGFKSLFYWLHTWPLLQ